MHRKWIAIRASAVLAIAGSLATLAIGGAMLFGTLKAPPPATGPAMPPFPLAAIGIVMDAIRWGMAGLYGVLAAIGVWWLVLFNLSSTKEYFAQHAPSQPPSRPLSV